MVGEGLPDPRRASWRHDEGSYLLENSAGSWQGRLHGRVLGDGLHLVDGVMRGSGAYAGLTYHYHLEMMPSEYWNVSGWISEAR